MGLVRRLIRLVWGEEVDPALRPALAVGLAGTIAGATVYPFLGVCLENSTPHRFCYSRSRGRCRRAAVVILLFV